MFLFIIIFCTVFYVAIAEKTTKKVWNITNSKVKRNLVLWFFILLPFWDVLLGYMVYIPMCRFWAGDKVYKTVKGVNSVYYDTTYPRYGITNYNKPHYFKNGITNVEMNVTELLPGSIAKEVGLNRFWVDSSNGKLCSKKIDKIMSNIVINTTNDDYKIIPITVIQSKIYDNSNNMLLAKSNALTIRYLSIVGIPFFNWLKWYDQGYSSNNCKSKTNIITLTINK